MRSALRYGVLVLACAGCIGAAAANEFLDDHVTGTIGRAATQTLPLSNEQLGCIFLGVVNLPDTPEVSLADAEPPKHLPSSVELQDLPAMVIRQVPMVKGYKFVKLDDRILLIRPSTRAVVAEIPLYRLVQ